jgi:hypothetical protein
MISTNDISPEYRLENIYIALGKEVFSKNQASRLVGGRARLNKLVSLGKIRVDKPANVQNGKWFCNAGDVIKHIQII